MKLVIGGGEYNLADDCISIGNHPTSFYGIGKDWNVPQFWTDLVELILNLEFEINTIVFDSGSESWMNAFSEETIYAFLFAISSILSYNGIIIVQGYCIKLQNEFFSIGKWLQYEFDNPIGICKFGNDKTDNCINYIFGRNTIDNTFLSGQPVYPFDFVPATYDSRGFINWNPEFKMVQMKLYEIIN
jgi:hypothetical protein